MRQETFVVRSKGLVVAYATISNNRVILGTCLDNDRSRKDAFTYNNTEDANATFTMLRHSLEALQDAIAGDFGY